MRRIIYLLLIGLFCISTAALAQDSGKKPSKQERKKAEKELELQLFDQARKAIEDRSFVLEADRIVFKNGRSAYVTSLTNFVSVNDDRAVVQISMNGRAGGPNGIGGITVEGAPSKYIVKYDKKGNLSMSMLVQGIGISAQVFIKMAYGNNSAMVDINPNFNSNRMTFHGTIIPFEYSKTFKGRSL